MTRFKVTVTTFTNAPSAEEAAERVMATVGSRFALVSAEADEATDEAINAARKAAAHGLERWKSGASLPAGLTPCSAYELLKLMHAYFVLENSRGRA